MKNMYKSLLLTLSAILLAACTAKVPVDPSPEGETERIEFTAISRDADSKVIYEYTNGLHMKWKGDESLEVYIQHAYGSCDGVSKGTLHAVEGTLADEGYSLKFAGEAQARQLPGDKFVLAYTGEGSFTDNDFNWTRQTLEVGSDSGLSQLKRFTPITWTDINSANPVMTKHACVIKFTGSGLPANAAIKSIAIVANGERQVAGHAPGHIFPTGFSFANSFRNEAGDGNVINDGGGLTLVYVFTDARTDNSGAFTAYLAAPVIDAVGESVNNFSIQIICEESNGTVSTKKATQNITAGTFMSGIKLYNLGRTAFVGSVNPATVIGGVADPSDPNDPLNNTESITGQWDKFGALSNDIYGVLEKGKNITDDHRALIEALYQAYTSTAKVGDKNTFCDSYIHPVMARLASPVDDPIDQSTLVTVTGPQYVATSVQGTDAAKQSFNNIVLTKDTEVYMTFINTLAWNFNTIGYYCYPHQQETEYQSLDKFKDTHKYVVIPSTSDKPKDGHRVLPAKTTAQLLYPDRQAGSFATTFPKGTVIGLFDIVNGMDTSSDFALKEPGKYTDGDVYFTFTNIAWNAINDITSRPFPGSSSFYNFIAAARIKFGNTLENHALLYGIKDKPKLHSSQNAATWTNPIILIYTSKPDAIAWNDSYWPTTEAGKYVDLSEFTDYYTIQSTMYPDSYVYVTGAMNNWNILNNANSSENQRKWIITSAKGDLTNVDNIVDGETYYLYSLSRRSWLNTTGQITIGQNWLITSQNSSDAMPIQFYRNSNGSYRIVLKYPSADAYAWGHDTKATPNSVFGTQATYLDDGTRDWIITLH